MTPPRPRRAASRRAFVLVAVIVVLAAAILVATGAIFVARSSVTAAAAADADAGLRHAALDGAVLAAARLHEQRERILSGGEPELEPELLSRGEGATRVVASLAPLSRRRLLESESAKLDFNACDPEMLRKAFADAGAEAAEVLDALLAARPLASIDGAAGQIEEPRRLAALRTLLGPMRAVGGPVDDAPGEATGDPVPLIARLGVHAREPLVDAAGAPRLDVVAAFGEEGNDATRREFSDAVVEVLEAIAGKEQPAVPDDGAMALALLSRGVPVAEIARTLDACTLHAGALAPARVDVARADAGVLAALPGLDADRAARIVEAREGLDEDERGSTAWLVERGVLTAQEWARLAGRISSRSTTWRFRVEARTVAAESGDGERVPAPGAVAVLDCIVDLAGDEPRIAYLRESTMLPTARLLARSRAELFADERGSPSRDVRPEESGGDFSDSSADSEPEREAGAEEDTTDPPPGLEDSPRPATIAQPEPARPERGRARAVGRDRSGAG